MKKWSLFLILLLSCNPMFSQSALTINGANLTVAGTAKIVLVNTQWVNNGSFTAGEGAVILRGDALDPASAIGGDSETTFYDLEIDKTSNGVQLQQAIQVDNELQMTAGNLDLNGFDLTLGEANGVIIGESADSYIGGEIGGEVIKTANLNAPNAENPGNLGASITSGADLGQTIIRRGHQAQNIDGVEGIKRYYDVLPTNNTALDATLQLYYFNHELNGLAETELTPARDNNGNWEYYEVARIDTVVNYVETNVQAFSLWTLGRGGVGLRLSPVVLLQGPYDLNTGLMSDLLRANGILPLSEPFTDLGYTHIGSGGENTLSATFDLSGMDAIVDWVFLELRDKTDRNTVIATRSALLQRDGDVVDVDGESAVSFMNLPPDDYYLVVKHRNHLGVMSAAPFAISNTTTSIDFTSDINNIFGGANGIANLGDGLLGLFSGDFNRNGQVQNTDYNDMIFTLGVPGYREGDFDLNGQVQNTDLQLKLIPNIGRGQPFGL